MRVLFATSRAYPPDASGGTGTTAHAVMAGLRDRGHDVAVACRRDFRGWRRRAYGLARVASLRRWLGPRDLTMGYPVHRAARYLVPELATRLVDAAPDTVVLTDDPALLPDLPRGVPAVLFLVDTTFTKDDAGAVDRERLAVVANSTWTASRAAERLGVEAPVIPPLLRVDDYRVERSGGRYATLVNPVPMKGLDLVLELARRLPHRPFLLVQAWRDEPPRELVERTDRLDNVEVWPWRRDPRDIYRATRVMLVPSLVEEGFGRVVVEAQASGIPVVASDRGALPETVGGGGLVLDPTADPSLWAEAVEHLLSDPDAYRRASDRARSSAERPELSPDRVLDGIEEVMEGLIRPS